MEHLPVIFRAEKSGQFKGEITAVFPTLPGAGAYNMVCYAHIGQHSTCSFGWYRGTRPATPDEYGPLLAELRGIYEAMPAARPDIYGKPVRLEVRKRISPVMDQKRQMAAMQHYTGGAD